MCKKNNQRAQLELYNRYNKAMYNAVYPILQDRVLAEEATQEGFIIAFRKLNQYQMENSFGGWLKKIVLRKSFEYYRQKFRFVPLTEASENDQIASETEGNTVLQERKKKLYKALSQLKPSDQILLKLYYLEGYDHEELTEILQISHANCRTRLSRAKNKLTKLLIP